MIHMKILITGGNGQLGTELSTVLERQQSELGAIPACYQGAQAVSYTHLEPLFQYGHYTALLPEGKLADGSGVYRFTLYLCPYLRRV